MSTEAISESSRKQSAELPELATGCGEILASLATAIKADRASLWQIAGARKGLRCFQLRCSDMREPPSALIGATVGCPRYLIELERSGMIAAVDAARDKRLAEFGVDYVSRWKVGALLDFPVRSEGILVAVLRVEQLGEPREWSDRDQQFAAFAADALAQRLAQDQLRQSNARLQELSSMQQAILDGADYSLISTDVDGTIRSFNAAACRMLGYSADELIGLHSPAIFHDASEIAERAAELSAELKQRVEPGFEVFVSKARQGQAEEREWTFIRKDGSRFPVRLSVTPVRDREGRITGYMGIAADLTERQLARESLRDSEARYHTLFEGTGDSIFLMRGEQFVDCNPATLRMFGCTREQIIGQPPYRFSPEYQPDGRRSEEKALEKIGAAFKGQTQHFDWLHCRYDGGPFDAEVTLNAVEIRGEPHLLATVRDTSERKQARASLRDSEARYHTLFEGTGDSIFLMRGEQFVDCNPATLNMFGCTREQIIGQPPYRYSPEFQPDGRRSDEKAVEKITAAFNGQTQNFEWMHCRFDNSLFDAEVTLNVVEIRGEPHLLATVRDTSERKRAEAELALSRKTLLERNDSLRLINRLSTQLHGSLETEDILAISVDALLGLTPKPHVTICMQDGPEQPLQIVASEGRSATMPVGAATPLAAGLHKLAVTERRLFVSTNFAADTSLPAPIRAELADAKVQAGVVVPLLYRGVPLGSICLLYDEGREFGEIELDSFTAIGNTVALALASARHVDGLEYLAHHDSLTGLPNRMFLHREFEHVVASRDATHPGAALLLLDLDRFKEINDTLGHHIGDLLLQQIGPRLKSALGDEAGIMCRLGGDEFALLLPNAGDPAIARKVAQNLLVALRAPFLIDAMQLLMDASMGIAFYPADGDDSHAMLRSADVAMYEAKRKGGGIAIYDRSLDQNSPERLGLIADLNQAIRDRQLSLHYQPKLDLKTGSYAGFEALVRWQHPRLGLLHPESFLELAELSETIHPLTDLVLELAMAQMREWRDAGQSCSVSVNLSARNLIDDRCLLTIRNLMQEYQIGPGELEVEITETALMHDPEQAAERLDRIAALGVRISVDDYGTGYSSLGYLHRLPINALKIDRLFVTDMCDGVHNAIIVRSTIALAHSLGLIVVAEGVEDARTQELLHSMGCDQIQGFHISKPMPPEQLTQFIADSAAA
jgi:diguanylate cyclase (GGDEF)-like protein/PAS domain S-box-containing protein